MKIYEENNLQLVGGDNVYLLNAQAMGTNQPKKMPLQGTNGI